jgi:hypothetical protein
MNRMRLTRGRQIVIFLSLAWIVGGGAYRWSAHTSHAHSAALAEYESCVELSMLTHNRSIGECSERSSRTLAAELKGMWGDVAIVALVPTALVWLVAYLVAKFRRRAAALDA